MSSIRQTPRWLRRAAILLGFVGVSAGARANRERITSVGPALLARIRR